MNNTYIKEILTDYQDKITTTQAVLFQNGVFPDMDKPVRRLKLFQELILKTTFLLKVNFLEETVVLFAFAYSKEQTEKNVLELERQGYIHSVTTPEYGKAFALTRQALFYIKHHPDYSKGNKLYQELSINEDTIPKEAGLMRYKNSASYLSQKVFYTQLAQAVSHFRNMDKKDRQTYSRTQYVRYFLYKDFLTWNMEMKAEYLQQMGFSEKVISRYADNSLFSTTFSQNFAKQYLEVFGEDSIEALPAYQVLRRKINESLKEKPIKKEFLFHFLKDFTNENQADKEQVLTEIFKAFQSDISNMLRDKDTSFRNALISNSKNTDILVRERVLYLYKEIERVLSINRRNLLKTNAFQKGKTEGELSEATRKLELLDLELEKTAKSIQKLEDDFLLLLYEGITQDQANLPKEKVLTFQSLKSSCIFVGDIERRKPKDIITFVIVSSTTDPIDVMALFQRLEKIWNFYYHYLLEYDFQIKILCYGEQRTKQTIKTFQKVLEWIAEIREYQLLHLLITERTTITDCEFHPKQRYEVYRELSEQMKAIT